MNLDDIRRAVVELTEAWKDADAVTADLLKPTRHRELGPVLHRENYDAARAKLDSSLADLARAVGNDGDPPPSR